MNTQAEDEALLKYAGMMGHEFVGVAGDPGRRRTVCETNSLDSAKRLCDETTLAVYRSNGSAKRRRWFSCYDRRGGSASGQ